MTQEDLVVVVGTLALMGVLTVLGLICHIWHWHEVRRLSGPKKTAKGNERPGDENDALLDWLDVFDRAEFEDWTSGTSQRLRVHAKGCCHGTACPIHHPTDHHMRDWPTHYRRDRGLMERLCPHGVGHPDPDDPTTDRTHGCDGCCDPASPPR